MSAVISEEYKEKYGDHAVQIFVRDLMVGDPVNFKRGYTFENAVIAAEEAFGISKQEVHAELDYYGE